MLLENRSCIELASPSTSATGCPRSRARDVIYALINLKNKRAPLAEQHRGNAFSQPPSHHCISLTACLTPRRSQAAIRSHVIRPWLISKWKFQSENKKNKAIRAGRKVSEDESRWLTPAQRSHWALGSAPPGTWRQDPLLYNSGCGARWGREMLQEGDEPQIHHGSTLAGCPLGGMSPWRDPGARWPLCP